MVYCSSCYYGSLNFYALGFYTRRRKVVNLLVALFRPLCGAPFRLVERFYFFFEALYISHEMFLF